MTDELRKLVETSNALYRNSSITGKTVHMHNFLEALANAEVALSSAQPQDMSEFPEAETVKEAQRLYPSADVHDIHKATSFRFAFIDGARFAWSLAMEKKVGKS